MPPTAAANPEATRFADQLARSYDGGAWHGPGLRELLGGLDARTASRPGSGGAHSIWELTLHIAAWLDIAARRAVGEAPPIDGEHDWPPVRSTSDAAWAEARAALEAAHLRLHGIIRDLDDQRLDDAVDGMDPTLRGLLFGVLQHNTYHGGQIALLAKSVAATSGGG